MRKKRTKKQANFSVPIRFARSRSSGGGTSEVGVRWLAAAVAEVWEAQVFSRLSMRTFITDLVLQTPREFLVCAELRETPALYFHLLFHEKSTGKLFVRLRAEITVKKRIVIGNGRKIDPITIF